MKGTVMTEQDLIAHNTLFRMKKQQPGLFAQLPESIDELGIVPHLGMPYPYLSFGKITYCPFAPLNSSGMVGSK
jgi:hypothetical protein